MTYVMSNNRWSGLALGVLFLCGSHAVCAEQSDGTLLLRQPALSRERLAFIYGGDIWGNDAEHPLR